MREEYNYWQDRLVRLTYDRVEFDRKDADCELRHLHYTLKLFRLLHSPVQVSKRLPALLPAGSIVN